MKPTNTPKERSLAEVMKELPEPPKDEPGFFNPNDDRVEKPQTPPLNTPSTLNRDKKSLAEQFGDLRGLIGGLIKKILRKS